MRTDAARGDYHADVWTQSDLATFLLGVEEGLVEPFETEHEFPEMYNAIIPYGYPTHLTIYGIGMNTNLVSEQEQTELSQSWDALLDPKWKGKITTADPSQSGTMFNAYFNLKEAMGDDVFWDWLEKFSQQDVAVFDGAGPPRDAVVRGEFSIVAPVGTQHFSRDIVEGAPVATVTPNPVPGSAGVVGLAANAPHTNAAKVFIKWFISREGQQEFNEYYGTNSAIPDLAGGSSDQVMEVYVTLTQEQLDKQIAERDEFLARFSQIMGLQ